ncbi:porin [Streptosporangium jomthongense]|uniref:OmpA family protein n=1 Tax=Marinobacter aromaticivorans TaxID=1494078 RepID=A0ABW2IYN9_9GAMM|nr:OmpA family protein [Marinobacter aromaticivorans]GGE76919.1 porin [Streptosporangium jomthongense]
MNKRNITLGMAAGLSLLIAGCATTPPENAMVNEARASYEKIKDDPDVARSGDRHLRSARDQLNRAESLLDDGADTVRVEHAAYLANRHAQIANEQGERARLQKQIDSAEERRRKLLLAQRSSEAEQARKEAEMLRKRMEELQAERTDRGMVLTLGDVLFDLNKADLKPSGEQTIDRLAQFMKEYEDRRVRVEGYTDSTGEASYNQRLSERRAQAVRDELISRGIESRRVETKGFGEQYPVASNDTAAGRQQNRRVEIVISDKDGNIETR